MTFLGTFKHSIYWLCLSRNQTICWFWDPDIARMELPTCPCFMCPIRNRFEWFPKFETNINGTYWDQHFNYLKFHITVMMYDANATLEVARATTQTRVAKMKCWNLEQHRHDSQQMFTLARQNSEQTYHQLLYWDRLWMVILSLGGGFKYVLCSPLFGEDSDFDYVSKGLKPPTR